MRKLALTILVLLIVGISPVISWAGVLEDAEEYVRRNPNDSKGHLKLGKMYLSIASQIKRDTRPCYSENKVDCSLPHNLQKRLCRNLRPFSCSEGYEKERKQLLKAIASFKKEESLERDLALAEEGQDQLPRYPWDKKHHQLFPGSGMLYLAENKLKVHERLYKSILERQAEEKLLSEYKEKKGGDDRDSVQIQRPSQPSSPALPPIAKAPPQSEQPPKAVESIYSGTGFLFSAKDYVITNWHVVRGTNNIKVKFLNGENIKATVALKDSQNDIAFLKLERQPKLPPSDLKIGDSSKVRMGDKVFTIGYPAHWVMGKNPKYTEGVVNATTGIADDPTVFQISVQIQPGNSGGPLFNSIGEVIGITQAALDPNVAIEAFGSTLPQNVNYAIKSSYISALLPNLPETLVASRGIVIVPTEPENSRANFIERVKTNIVLVEAVPEFKPTIVKRDYEDEGLLRKERDIADRERELLEIEQQVQEEELLRREEEIVEHERELLEKEQWVETEERLRREREIAERELRLQARKMKLRHHQNRKVRRHQNNRPEVRERKHGHQQNRKVRRHRNNRR